MSRDAVEVAAMTIVLSSAFVLQPLMEPAVRPCTMYFWKKSTSSTAGSAQEAGRGNHRVVDVDLPFMPAMTGGSVVVPGLVLSTCATMNSFQHSMNVRRPPATSPGPDTGSTTR
jgi:hypothetical protein